MIYDLRCLISGGGSGRAENLNQLDGFGLEFHDPIGLNQPGPLRQFNPKVHGKPIEEQRV